MGKESKQRFILSLKLNIELFQEDILNKRFEIGRKIYNAVLGKSYNRYKEMIKTKTWRENQVNISNVYKTEKDKNKAKKLAKSYFDIKKSMLQEFRLNEYSLHEDVKNMQHHFKSNIDSFTAQKIASNVWKAYDKLLYGNGETVHFKKFSEGLNSLEGKSNKTGIVYKIEDNKLVWNGLKIKVQSKLNDYEINSLRNKICYCRITRKFVRDKYKYNLQLVLEGAPPIKVNKETGEVKHYIGSGDVGLDIGTQTIAISSQSDVKIYELADKVQNIENQKRILLRKLDRSRRCGNPNNYNSDGTIKKQGNKKVIWIKSNNYKKIQNRLKELYRKQADVRKLQHEILSNYIISLGDNIYVETMNYAGLQKRAKKTEKDDKGKYKKKKRFGKSLANKAPSMLLSIIDRKLHYYGKQLIKIDTWSVKASQYNHLTETYHKKKLSERWNDLNGIKVQRDIYSAFLIMNVNNDLKSINQNKCNKRFQNFLMLHNKEIERLTGNKNLSSIAI